MKIRTERRGWSEGSQFTKGIKVSKCFEKRLGSGVAVGLWYVWRRSSVAGLEGVLGEPSVELHQFLWPRNDITDKVAAAGRLAVDLTGRQDPGPELEVGELPHEGLGDVEATSHRILWARRRTSQA